MQEKLRTTRRINRRKIIKKIIFKLFKKDVKFKITDKFGKKHTVI